MHDVVAIYNKIDKVVKEFFKMNFMNKVTLDFIQNPSKMNDKQINNIRHALVF